MGQGIQNQKFEISVCMTSFYNPVKIIMLFGVKCLPSNIWVGYSTNLFIWNQEQHVQMSTNYHWSSDQQWSRSTWSIILLRVCPRRWWGGEQTSCRWLSSWWGPRLRSTSPRSRWPRMLRPGARFNRKIFQVVRYCGSLLPRQDD